jgi:cytochrome c-type biogenesis protein CcmH
MRLFLLAILALLLAAPAAQAIAPSEMLRDPVLEARARDLGKELRCPKCQNQSLDDSEAGIAVDLRRIVRERLVAGDTDVQVKAYLTARYGDFVLLKPPMKSTTWALWFGPLAVILLGGVVIWRSARRNKARLAEMGDDGLDDDMQDDNPLNTDGEWESAKR